MSCALARSLQTGLAAHAMQPTAYSLVMACSPLESLQMGTGPGSHIQGLPSEISACQAPDTSARAAPTHVQAGTAFPVTARH